MTSQTENRFDPDHLERVLADVPLITNVVTFASLRSTNDLAKRLLQAGAPSGTLVLADRQTAGRGRHGRTWQSAPGLGLWLTLALRPPWPFDGLHLMPLFLSECVARTLQQVSGIPFAVKWPNDVIHQGRKISGILCETGFAAERADYLLAGIGINVNHAARDFPDALESSATSLHILTGRTLNRIALLRHLLQRISDGLANAAETARLTDLAGWKSLCADLGAAVAVRSAGRTREGVFHDVTPDGDMVIRDRDGALLTFPAAHATLNGAKP